MWRLLDERERQARGPVNKIRATSEVTRIIQARLVSHFGRVVGCPLGNLALELATTDDDAGQHAAAVLAEWEARVAGHCQDAAEVGWLKPGIEPEQLAHIVIGTMQGMILLAKVSNTSAVAVSEAMDRGIEHGVRSRS